ncbi:MAG: polysaccharide deacetylase family protein [Clostridia bacterium]|nr:polysaccharide deacetylase family protein [Clostridia bacterium]
MKKIIAMVLCSLFLLTGCNTAEETINTDTQSKSNEAVGWGFVRKKGSAPDIPSSQKEMLAKYDCYYIDENSPKTLYLTFDEGYENGYTSKILDVLEKTQTPAAFFVTGPYLENQQELVQRMIDNGHIVGNHTVNHPNLANQSTETVKKELDDLNKLCEEKYGVTMQYMRPPEGSYSENVLSTAQSMGYKTILWSFAYKDWDINMQQGGEYAFSQVTPYLHDGAILLLHAVSSDNANALEDIINYAKDEGYVFKSLDNLK